MRHLRLLFLLMLVLVPVNAAFAQTPTASPTSTAEPGSEPSDGCTTLGSLPVQTANPTASLGQHEFFAGETVSADVTGPGTSFVLSLAGGGVTYSASNVVSAGAVELVLPVDGVFDVNVDVTGATTPNTQADLDCVAADGDDDDGDDDDPDDDGLAGYTICHVPPGNPGNAHTIQVGSQNAVNAHLRHGDYEGECDEEDESRSDGENGVITFSDEISGIIAIFGACVGTNCSEVGSVDINILLDLDPEELEFGDSWEFEAVEGWQLIVFFLGPNSNNEEGSYVFQLNVYRLPTGDTDGDTDTDDDADDDDGDDDDGDDDDGGSGVPVLQDDHLLIIINFNSLVVTTASN